MPKKTDHLTICPVLVHQKSLSSSQSTAGSLQSRKLLLCRTNKRAIAIVCLFRYFDVQYQPKSNDLSGHRSSVLFVNAIRGQISRKDKVAASERKMYSGDFGGSVGKKGEVGTCDVLLAMHGFRVSSFVTEWQVDRHLGHHVQKKISLFVLV